MRQNLEQVIIVTWQLFNYGEVSWATPGDIVKNVANTTVQPQNVCRQGVMTYRAIYPISSFLMSILKPSPLDKNCSGISLQATVRRLLLFCLVKAACLQPSQDVSGCWLQQGFKLLEWQPPQHLTSRSEAGACLYTASEREPGQLKSAHRSNVLVESKLQDNIKMKACCFCQKYDLWQNVDMVSSKICQDVPSSNLKPMIRRCTSKSIHW